MIYYLMDMMFTYIETHFVLLGFSERIIDFKHLICISLHLYII